MTLFYLFIAVVPASVLLFTAFYTFKKHMQGAPRKKTVRINAVTFLVVAVLATMMTVTVSAADKDAEPVPQEQVQTVEEAEVKEESGDSLSKASVSLQQVFPQVLPASAAVSQLRQALRLLSRQQAKIRKLSVNLLSLLPSVNLLHCTALLSLSFCLMRKEGERNAFIFDKR